MLCHEHAHVSKLPYLDEEYSFQACVEADAERIERRLERQVARASASSSRYSYSSDDGDDDDDVDGRGREGRRVGQNPFLPGLVGSAVTFEEERLAEFLEEYRDDDDDDDDCGNNDDECQKGDASCIDTDRLSRKRRKRRQFNYCLPLDFKELASLHPSIFFDHSHTLSHFLILAHIHIIY